MTEREGTTPETKEKSPEEVLLSIVDTQRILPFEYQTLILQQEQRGEKMRGVQSSYAVVWQNILREDATLAREFFKQHLSRQTLIDLGGGTGSMEEIAMQMDSSVYVNVERAPYESTEMPNPHIPIFSERKKNSLQLGVHSDMLAFVSRVKDGAGNFTINGIDAIIVSDQKYNAALAKEIIRATKVGGLIFGTSSVALDYLKSLVGTSLRLVNMKEEFHLQMDEETFVFEKVE